MNHLLSDLFRNRADAVKKYSVDQGIDSSRLHTRARGEDTSGTDTSKERRVDICRSNDRPAVLYIIFGLQLLKGLASAQSAPTAKAVIKDGKGRQVGIAILTESSEGLRIAVDAENLPPGSHGFHIHNTGKCDPPDFKSAGPHFNPGAMKHGMKNPDGPHAGDLQDIEVEERCFVQREKDSAAWFSGVARSRSQRVP